ncbi:MAG: Vitamin B12 import ATP-binding protein BtuD [Sodalis sp.]|uniref:ATP-binding cassette domain-containing protein n=1 Tax=Sodalis sp. (in: enterobacteria) TaxID=1898979 RepID=UPI0038733FE0|nr:MAG: Vitamin B12 import ATP-binding protein BtuD [Sodalis sp.]
MTRIEVTQVGKNWGHFPSSAIAKWVLKDISFTVQAGESVGIVGVNGAGKSTLLKLLTDTTKPTLAKYPARAVAALLEYWGWDFIPIALADRMSIYLSGLMKWAIAVK